MELHTLLVADYANVAEGGKLNVMGIFRQIFASTFPARHSQMYLVTGLSASAAEYDSERKLSIKLINEDATEELVHINRDIKVPKNPSGYRSEMRFIFQLRDIIFPKDGTYEFSVLVDQDVKGHYSIEVIKDETLASRGLIDEQKK